METTAQEAARAYNADKGTHRLMARRPNIHIVVPAYEAWCKAMGYRQPSLQALEFRRVQQTALADEALRQAAYLLS